MQSEYTTIRKKIKEYDVIISDDPKELDGDRTVKYKNLLRVTCVNGTKWATFLISKMMLNNIDNLDGFVYKNLEH